MQDKDNVSWGKVLLLFSVLTFWYGLSWLAFPTVVNSFNGILAIKEGTLFDWLPYVNGIALIVGSTIMFLFSMRIRKNRRRDIR
ncbi:MAG: hypothetical protein R6U17_09625 [Thermoplasmata archaeon]